MKQQEPGKFVKGLAIIVVVSYILVNLIEVVALCL